MFGLVAGVECMTTDNDGRLVWGQHLLRGCKVFVLAVRKPLVVVLCRAVRTYRV